MSRGTARWLATVIISAMAGVLPLAQAAPAAARAAPTATVRATPPTRPSATPTSPAKPAGRAATGPVVREWLTTGDQVSLLSPQPNTRFAPTAPSPVETVSVDDSASFQPMTGFGAALTDSSAWLLSRLPAATLDATLRSLFSRAAGGRLSVLRVPLGASDFVVGQPYTYDDQPPGAADPGLAGFSIARDESYLLPLLRRIRAINPGVKIIAAPWSAPAWMKTGGSPIGGSLAADREDAYAGYLVRTLKAFAADGAAINALTVQNEPEWSPPDYPGMTLSAAQEAEFVALHLGPALRRARMAVALIGYDHNWDDVAYPSALFGDQRPRPIWREWRSTATPETRQPSPACTTLHRGRRSG